MIFLILSHFNKLIGIENLNIGVGPRVVLETNGGPASIDIQYKERETAVFNSPSFGIKNLLLEVHYSTHSSSDLFGVLWLAMLTTLLVIVYNMVKS